MLLHRLFNHFKRKEPNAGIDHQKPIGGSDVKEPSPALLYPPTDPGMRLSSTDELLEANSDLVIRLKLHAALPINQFTTRFLDPIYRLANIINCLPATATAHFSGQGGLLRSAMEMAFQSFQASDGRIFTSNATVEQRHLLEVRWRYTCFVVGLLYPVGIPLDVITVSDTKGIVWRKQLSGVTDWAAGIGATHVYVGWPQSSLSAEKTVGPSPSTTAYIQQVIGVENLQWLEDGSADFVKLIYSITAGQSVPGNPINGLLTEMWDRVLTRESARRPLNYGRVVSGTHIGPYLSGVLRDLFNTGRWKVNGDVLIVDQSGVYLVWPAAAKDIIEYGQDKQYQGWPNDVSTIEALLKSTEIVIDNKMNMGYVEVINNQGEVLQALQLTNPMTIIVEYEASDYLKQEPKTLEGAKQADPLPAAAPKKEKRSTKSQAADSDSVIQTPEQQRLLEQGLSDEYSSSQETQASAHSHFGDVPTKHNQLQATFNEPISRPVETKPQQKGAANTPDSVDGFAPMLTDQVAAEAPDVRFADLLPSDVRKQFRNPLIAEFLGKIIKLARNSDAMKPHMRMTDNGLAIQRKWLQDNIREMNIWLDAMSAAGYIYTDSATPGKKIYEVAIPLGTKPVNAVILSRIAVKKLDI